jgi:hypothetical protein
MSTKSLLKLVVAFGLLAMLLIFLGVNYVPRISASSSTKENLVFSVKDDLVIAAIQARPDYINESFPRAIVPQQSLAGSDWFERHPSAAILLVKSAGSDFLNHHPFAVIQQLDAGSDFLNRHPFDVTQKLNYAGSDWIERNPSNYYSKSDWIERQPKDYFSDSDYSIPGHKP